MAGESLPEKKKTEGLRMEYFDGVKKNFGFGCMRLPMKGEKVDYEEFSRMIDYYLAEGFNYFDTAHVALSGKAEEHRLLREANANR